MTIAPINLPLTIYQGADFTEVFEWKTAAEEGDTPTLVNLTGYSARMQARPTKESATKILDLDTGTKGGITLGGTAGAITVTLSAAVTAALVFGQADQAYYDLELESGSGHVTRVLEGTLVFSREVTR